MDVDERKEQNRKEDSQKIATRFHVAQSFFFVVVVVIVAIALVASSRAYNNTLDKLEATQQQIINAANDNKLTAKRLGDTITCMLLVPVGQRTTDTQKDCREKAIRINPDGVVLEDDL